MNDYVNQLMEYLGPVASSKLGHAFIGLLILILGLFVVKIITGIVRKGLNRIDVLNREQQDGTRMDFASPLASIVKAVLTIFVLMAVLQHFGLTDVLAPLKDMTNKFTAAIPNIVGASIIMYAGWVIAKIVADLTGLGLNKVDEQIAEKTNFGDIKIAKFGSAFIFGGILLPIVVSALGVLNIPAISEPASAMIQKLMAAVPNIVGAGIILLVAYFVTKFVIYMLLGLLEGANIDAFPAKIGMEGIFTTNFTPTKLVSGSIMFFSMLAASTAAVNILGIDVITQVFARILEFGGGLLVGALILIIGNLLGSMAHDKLIQRSSVAVANIARVAILGLVLAMGLKAMGLADNIVNMAFGFTFGSVAVASALAFGLGGRDAAKKIADGWADRIGN